MTDETLNKTLAGLRDDIDMLLNTHYSASPDGIAGMKTRIASAIANIDTLTKNLSETNTKLAQDEQTLSECKFFDDYMTQQIIPQYREDSLSLFNLYRDIREFLNEFLTNEEAADAIELYQKNDLWEPYLKQLRQILDILSVQDAQDLKNMLSSGSTGGSTVSTELQEQVETNTTNITELQSKVNANTTNLGTLQTQVDANTTNITSLQTQANTFATDIASMQTQVDTNTTNITTLQGKVTTLENQVAKYLTPPDPNYTGKTFTDYPAGTIIQTYDFDERNYDFSHSQMLTTPTLYFCAEKSAVAKIKITSKVSLQTAGIVKIKTFLNGTQIDEHNFDMLADSTLQQVSFDIFDANLNTEDKANNIYTTICYNNSSGNTVTLKYQKVEVIASNIMFLNKLCPFYALYFNGKYYLTDCSSGTIKIAEIEAENMHNMDNLTWTDTQIPAQECQPTGSYNVFSGESIEIGTPYYAKRTLANRFYIGTLENNFQKKQFASIFEFDYITQFSKNIYFVSKMDIDQAISLPYYDPTKDYMGRITSQYNNDSCVKLSGQKYYDAVLSTNIPAVNIRHNNNGECFLQNQIVIKDIQTYQLVDGDISSLILTNYTSSSKYDIHAYVHHYDKTIRYDFSYNKTATEPFTLNSVKEIGTYDKIFEMPNNYYFAVKNNQLHFYKFEVETE